MYINNTGHMTKMAAMPIHVHGKTHKKSSSQEPVDQGNLACSIGNIKSTTMCL